MIRVNVEQRTEEWLRERVGVPTASQFSRLITKTGKLSASANLYLYELVAENYLDALLDNVTTSWMERGVQLEESAIAWYELQKDITTEKIGFCLTDDRRVGCSPDRLVGTQGGLEIKCPKPGTHVSYLLGSAETEYKPQIQGCLWVCEREWWDFVSYNPVLPSALVRCYRDEAYIKTLAEIMDVFLDRLAEAKEKMRELVSDKLAEVYTSKQAG